MTVSTAPQPLLLSPSMKRKLEAVAVVRTFASGEVILSENAHIRSIPIVISGSIRVMRTDEAGKELLIYYIKPGESCIMSFLGGIHQQTSKIKAIAEEDVEIYLIPQERIVALIRGNSEWLDYVFRLYHKRFEELLEIVNTLAFRNIDDRLFLYLHEKASLAGTREVNITHQHIAEELGTSRVVISRILKQMESAHQLKLGRNKIILV